jgi:hypothetical protein
VYAFFDGDNVGNRLEILLTEEKVEEAVRFSRNIQAALVEIEGLLLQREFKNPSKQQQKTVLNNETNTRYGA